MRHLTELPMQQGGPGYIGGSRKVGCGSGHRRKPSTRKSELGIGYGKSVMAGSLDPMTGSLFPIPGVSANLDLAKGLRFSEYLTVPHDFHYDTDL
jgi:hypothetical protein